MSDGHKVAPAAAGDPSTHYTDKTYKLTYRWRAATVLLGGNKFCNDPAGMEAVAPRFVTIRRRSPFILPVMSTITNSDGGLSHHRLIQFARWLWVIYAIALLLLYLFNLPGYRCAAG